MDQRRASDENVINGRIGMTTSTYKVIKFIGMTTRNENRGHGRKYTFQDAVYECQCTLNPAHPMFTRTGNQIDTGVIVGCKACTSEYSRKRIYYNTIAKHIGTTVGGAKCLRVAYMRPSRYGIQYVWECPCCHNVFNATSRAVLRRADRYATIDCGCQSGELIEGK